MNEFEERWRYIFKNHVATLQKIDEDTQILTWKEEGTIVYSVEFIFRKNRIHIGGDCGSATFNTTWKPRWNYDWEHTYLGYFAEKCDSIRGGKFVWDEDAAFKTIKEEYREYFDDLSDDEYDDFFEKLKDESEWQHDWDWIKDNDFIQELSEHDGEIKQMHCVIVAINNSSSTIEFVNNLQNSPDFVDFNNFWEWGYHCGEVLSSYFGLWLTALRMAKEQLLSKEEEND